MTGVMTKDDADVEKLPFSFETPTPIQKPVEVHYFFKGAPTMSPRELAYYHPNNTAWSIP